MKLRVRLQNHIQFKNVKWEVIEKDYVLSWVLAGISMTPKLKEGLVFKGGTALKKMYFGDYRFSEDVDFSGINEKINPEELQDLMTQACEKATTQIQALGENVELKSKPSPSA